MGISKKKRQYIKKNYHRLSMDEIVAKTGLCAQDIESVLDIRKPEKNFDIAVVLNFIIEYGLLFCIFVSPFIIMPGLRDAADLPQNAFVQVFILVLAVAWAGKGIIDKEMRFIYSPLLVPLFALLLWCLVSLFAAVNPFEGLPLFLQLLSMVTGFVIVLNIYYIKYIDGSPDIFDNFVLALVFAGTGIAVIGIIQYLFKFSMIPQARPPAATFVNRNMAAQFMVITFPFSVWLFLTADRKITTWFAVISSVLMLVYVVYTKTLAAWISVSVEIGIFFLIGFYMLWEKRRRFRIKNKFFYFIVMTVLVLVFINVNSGGMNFKFGGLSQQISIIKEFFAGNRPGSITGGKKASSIEWRWAIWSNSIAMIKDHPLLGVGIGNYKIYYPLYHQAVIKDQKFGINFQPIRAHNDYIQAAVELGLTGIIIILSAILCLYFIILSVISKTVPGKEIMPGKTFLLLCVILSLITGVLINACFSFPFQRAIPPFLLMLMAAIVSGIYAGDRKSGCWRIKNRHGLYFIAICLIFGLGYYAHFYYSRIQFDKFYGKTIICYNGARWHDLLDEADKALSYSPDRKEILFYMGFASYKLGNTKKSIQYYSDLLRYYPHYLNALINIGVSYGKLNMNEKAAAAYKEVNRILPDNPLFYNDTGHYLQEEGKLKQACKYFKKAVRLDGNNFIIQANLGVVCFMLKKYPEAALAFKKAIKLKPGWALPVQYLKIIEHNKIMKGEN